VRSIYFDLFLSKTTQAQLILKAFRKSYRTKKKTHFCGKTDSWLSAGTQQWEKKGKTGNAAQTGR
jgi:hypothetical protein